MRRSVTPSLKYKNIPKRRKKINVPTGKSASHAEVICESSHEDAVTEISDPIHVLEPSGQSMKQRK